jgi:hypothetical protein
VHSTVDMSDYADHLRRIVEFASREDSQRAIRELSESSLLGRPVFIREVMLFARLHHMYSLTLHTGPGD